MDPETRKQKEDELAQLRIAADEAHQAVADTPDDEALVKAADDAEEKFNSLKAELDANPPAASEDEEEEEEDIDFDKELKNLEGEDPSQRRAPVQRTPLEKAKRNLFFSAEAVKKLGGDPDEVLKKPKSEVPPAPPAPEKESDDDIDPRYVTVDHVAQQEADRLSGDNEAQAKVVMWHYNHSIIKTGNVRADIENAFYIANKGRIRRSIDEIRRAKVVQPSPHTPPGRKQPKVQAKVPQLSSGEISTMKRRGFSQQPNGEWHSKGYITRFVTGKGWITEPKPKK